MAAGWSLINWDYDENIRIFVDQDVEDEVDSLYIQIYNDVQAILPMHVTDIPQ